MRRDEAGRLLWSEEEEEEDLQDMRVANVQGTLPSRSSHRCGHPVSQNASKGKPIVKGHSKKLTHKSMDGLFDDWAESSSSRPHHACGAKVKVSSVVRLPALDYELSDASHVYAVCRAIDAACTGAEVDNRAVDIDAACDAIDAACASNIARAFDIEAVCHAIDVACASKD